MRILSTRGLKRCLSSLALLLIVAFTALGWPSGWPTIESEVSAVTVGTLLSITGVWLDSVDPAKAIPWVGAAGTPAASFSVPSSRLEYNEWHSIIVEGTCVYCSVCPSGFQIGGFLVEYDPADHRAFLIDQTRENLLAGGIIEDGKLRFRLQFRFLIDSGSIFGPMAGYRQLLGRQNFHPTLREGSAQDPAELIIFLGDTVLPWVAGGWTWWQVWGT